MKRPLIGGLPPTKRTKTESGSSTSDSVNKPKPKCEWGTKCYRRNLFHFAEFDHPTDGALPSAELKGDSKLTATPATTATSSTIKSRRAPSATVTLISATPVITSTSSTTAASRQIDYNKTNTSQPSKPKLTFATPAHALYTDGPLPKAQEPAPAFRAKKGSSSLQEIAVDGPVLTRTYKEFTSAERAQLVEEAVRLKALLEAERARADSDKHALQSQLVQEQAARAQLEAQHAARDTHEQKLWLPGELDILEGRGLGAGELLGGGLPAAHYMALYPERTHAGTGSAEQVHFRLAESQFYRLSTNGQYRVRMVEYCVAPNLVRAFAAKRRELQDRAQNEQDRAQNEQSAQTEGTQTQPVNSAGKTLTPALGTHSGDQKVNFFNEKYNSARFFLRLRGMTTTKFCICAAPANYLRACVGFPRHGRREHQADLRRCVFTSVCDV
jgi:hypothetical protein